MEKEDIARFLTAVGDPTRLELLILLKQHGRLNVGDIAANFKISRPAVSHHLKVLRDADVITSEKLGQEVYYWLNRESVITKLRTLLAMVEQCDASVE